MGRTYTCVFRWDCEIELMYVKSGSLEKCNTVGHYRYLTIQILDKYIYESTQHKFERHGKRVINTFSSFHFIPCTEIQKWQSHKYNTHVFRFLISTTITQLDSWKGKQHQITQLNVNMYVRVTMIQETWLILFTG